VDQTGKLEDVDEHLFRLVFIDGLRDFKQGLQLQFFPLVFVPIRLHVRGCCGPLSPFLWPDTRALSLLHAGQCPQSILGLVLKSI